MMISSKVLPVALLCFSLLCLLQQAAGQFPSICNNPTSLDTKTCCPNDCSGTTRGSCVSIRNSAESQGNSADQTIIAIIDNARTTVQKGTIDSRYLWPTMVFDRVCMCNGNYYGADCSECTFGWTGDDCQTRKAPVMRRSFKSLSSTEKQKVVNGYQMLKSDMGQWSVIVTEPVNNLDPVALQNVSTYDYLIYIHNYVARDASRACRTLNGELVDFAHSGPNFPVWHRTYLLILERAMQRVLRDETFGLPYWDWENNDTSPFASEYFGSLLTGLRAVNDGLAQNWKTVCDISYRGGAKQYFRNTSIDLCRDYWSVCNPMTDLSQNRNLERNIGNTEAYIPSLREVQMAIAAPNYDVPNRNNTYQQDSPRASFRSRLEGWSLICSASNCVQPQVSDTYQRVHNVVHDWIGGHMSVPASAVNDPIFSLHHCNIDRILESWMKKGTSLPSYVPTSGGHPGHNRDDYMVPFFPLITPGQQYSLASNWGYQYDYTIPAAIRDTDLSDCNLNDATISQCFVCTPGSSDCYCYKNSYGPCTECPAMNKNYCSSNTSPSNPPGSSSSKLGSNALLFLLFALLNTVAGYF